MRPSAVASLADHADLEFEKAIEIVSNVLLELDFVFGEKAGGSVPPGWDAYDWARFHPGDDPTESASVADYEDWLERLSKASEAVDEARTEVVKAVANRDPSLLNVWPG